MVQGYLNVSSGQVQAKYETQPSMKIPVSLAQSLMTTKQLNQNILALRQVAFSKFDMQIRHPSSHHDVETMNIPAIYISLLEETVYLRGPGNGFEWGHGHTVKITQ
ncbi:uncharacterized protein ACLA_017860 [Aspergillus clavatus NRRL 1]|uniref:Uncharacterized protein n=1 Tax=Aspergillus clavatus (strain ATCC 1007 / CBS 513.65 / DSM 816 / NCTC 3887 / NRRL 1 / QM 1276 / 107) TaxID=344612 RepID=A1CN62_ASPCL|nr:uncharacterized protein ACLA_017860 [Aspergillus clavatus NRRL 1]EAW07083.1 hypothetical protein ACLA_017860 [Aspergillus clavatus NRRL 1]